MDKKPKKAKRRLGVYQNRFRNEMLMMLGLVSFLPALLAALEGRLVAAVGVAIVTPIALIGLAFLYVRVVSWRNRRQAEKGGR